MFTTMNKIYIIPAVKTTAMETFSLIANSITDVEGNSNIQIGTGETPTEADVKSGYNVWNDDWSE